MIAIPILLMLTVSLSILSVTAYRRLRGVEF